MMFSSKIVWRLQILFLGLVLMSSVACTNATLTEQSLGLKSNKFSILQNSETTFLKVKSSDNSTNFTVDCPKNVTELYSNLGGGDELLKLQDVDCSSGSATVSYNFASFTSAKKIKFQGKGKDLETKEVEVTFIKPIFDNAGLAVLINSGALKTNTMAVVLSLTAQLKFEDMTFSPAEFYATSVAGCGSGGGWIPFAPLAVGTFLTTANAQNYVYVKFRDEFGDESSCVYDDISHDGVAPVNLSFQINAGAPQTLLPTVNLALAALDTDLTHMKISNNDNCTGGAWEAYATTKTGWSLSGPGTNKLSVLFRDAVGNLSACRSATIVYDTLPPVTPTSIVLSSGFTNPDNETSISFDIAPVIDGDIAKLYSDASCLVEVGSATGAGGSATVPMTVSVDGSVTVWSKVVDPGALTSSCTALSATYTLDRSAPAVQYLDSSLVDSDYVTGQTISVNVVFTEPVVVTGVPQLELNFNGTPKLANFSNVSGNTVTFNYLIEPNDADADLDVVGTGSLNLNGGDISDTLGNLADLALPSPGVSVDSLSLRRELKINFEVKVERLFAPTPKNYNYGDEITLAVKFTSPVVVTGTPRLRLKVSGCASDPLLLYQPLYRPVGYTEFLDEMVFRTNLNQVGCADTDGFSVLATSLELNGGTIKHASLFSDANLTLMPEIFSGAKTLYTQGAVPSFSFSSARQSVIEGGAVTLTINASVMPTVPITVSYRVLKSSSASLTDHDLPVTGSVVFNGVTSRNISFTTVDDALLEGTEHLQIVLTGATAGRIAAVSATTATTQISILDNDTPLISQVSIGTAHGCIRYDNGRLACWGANNKGQVGAGYPLLANKLVTVFSSGVTDVSAKGNGTCAIVSGQLYCWGDNTSGLLGNGTILPSISPTPQLVAGVVDPITVQVADGYVCVIFDNVNRKLTCWGVDSYGRLGNGAAGSVYAPSSTGILSQVSNFSASFYHICATKTDGAAYCWGYSYNGQTGTGQTGYIYTPTLVNISAFSPAVFDQVVAGDGASCGLLSTGSVTCWGSASQYRLGNGLSSGDMLVPTLPAIGAGFTELFAGSQSSYFCGRKAGNMFCWGYASAPAFYVATTSYTVPTQITDTATNSFYTMDINANANCFVDSSRMAVACTHKSLFNFPQASPILYPSPVDVSDLDIADMSVGETGSCFVTTAGQLKCASSSIDNSSFMQGDGITGYRYTPVVVAESNVSKVAVAGDATCFLRTDQSVWCFGSSTSSPIGDGSGSSTNHPHYVGSGFSELKTGADFFCGLRSGRVYCWGSNYYGQIGNNAVGVNAIRPTDVGLVNVTGLAMQSSSATVCAWGSDFVKCWGRGTEYQVGDGANANAPVPTDMVNIYQQAPKSVTMGTNHSCVVFADDSIRCWGRNNFGQLGRGTTADLPFAIDASLTSVATAAASMHSTCAIRLDGNLICWGRSYGTYPGWGVGRGLLGTLETSLDYEKSAADRIATPTLTNATQVWGFSGSSGSTYQMGGFCARSLGSIYCWGSATGIVPASLLQNNDYAPRLILGY